MGEGRGGRREGARERGQGVGGVQWVLKVEMLL